MLELARDRGLSVGCAPGTRSHDSGSQFPQIDDGSSRSDRASFRLDGDR
jgi:hypothetical protein